MFGKKKQPPIKSLIAQGTRIEGNVVFHDGLRVDGEVVGDIRASDEQSSILVISESASVSGQIHADRSASDQVRVCRGGDGLVTCGGIGDRRHHAHGSREPPEKFKDSSQPAATSRPTRRPQANPHSGDTSIPE